METGAARETQAARLREPGFFVLLSLLDVPLDGSGIIQLTEELSWGRVRLATGTLYGVLDHLTAKGYVQLVREEIVDGRVRRFYGLTPRGASALEAGAESMKDAASPEADPPAEGPRTGLELEPYPSSLAQRCRRLLLAYPAWYRRKRAEEMLGTLLETSPRGRQSPSFREARALLRGGMRVRGWVWRLSALWALLGAGGAAYFLICTMYGCTTDQCTTDEFLFPLYNHEPDLIGDVAVLGATVWILLAVPLLVAGFVRVRGWRRGNRLRAAAWAGAWLTAFVLVAAAVGAGGVGSENPGLGWGELELPVFALWLAFGAVLSRILSTPARSTDVPESLGPAPP